MKLDGYDVTEAEVDSFISTLNLEALKLNLTVKNARDVYVDQALWYTMNEDTTADKEIQFQLDGRVYALCCEHFADRKIEPQPPPTEQEQILTALAQQKEENLTIMMAQADAYEAEQANSLTIMLGIADLYEMGGVK